MSSKEKMTGQEEIHVLKSLYQICVKKTAELIKDNYPFPATEHDFNPFHKCPSEIVHSLIAEVIKSNHKNGFLNTSYLYSLLTSSSVKDLVIKNAPLDYEVLEDIFRIVLSSCDKIEKIQLINCERQISQLDDKVRSHPALESIILQSKKLKYIESSISFDLQLVLNIKNLEILILHFPTPESICDSPYVKAEILEMPKNSIRYFKVYENENDSISYAISKIALNYFGQLTYTNCCLSYPLEKLHFEENKPLSTKYKLKHLVLGRKWEARETFASPNAVYIATVTCPDVRSISIFADETDGLEKLSGFHKLEAIDIAFPLLNNISFIYDVLGNAGFGNNIKSLSISNVISFDLSVIANLCPNVSVLKLDFCNGCNSQAFAPNVFCFLQTLEIIMLSEKIAEESLFIMLSNASLLESLKLSHVFKFNDKIFEKVLKVNPLSCLTTLHLIRTSATEDGMLKFGENLNIQSFKWSASDH